MILAPNRDRQPDELRLCAQHLLAQAKLDSSLKLGPSEAADRSVASLCLILFASNEFLYIG